MVAVDMVQFYAWMMKYILIILLSRFNLDFWNLNQLKLKKWSKIFEPKGGRMDEVRKK